MFRHTDQWRFGVFWQDDGSDGQGGSTGFSSSVSYGGAPAGQGGIGSDAVAGGTAGAPAAPSAATAGPSGIAAPSYGGQSRGGGVAAAPSGGAAAPSGGAATGGGAGTAAGGSASGPGGGGAPGASGGAAGGTSIGDIAAGFFSSIMGSPANAKSLYGDPGSAFGYNPDAIRAANKAFQQGQVSNPFLGNLGVQSLINALSGNALGGGLGNVAQGTPSPPLGSLALAIALGDTFGALGGQAPGGATPGYGFDQATMGYPALEGVSPGLTAAPAGPSPAPFGGAVSTPSVRGPGSDANAPVSTYGDLGGGPAGQNTTGVPTGPGGAEVTGGMPTGLDFGLGVGPASDITSPGFGAPPSPSQAPGTIGVPGTTPTPSAVTSNAPSAVAATITNAPSPTAAAQSVAQAIVYQSPDQQSQTIAQALDVAQQTLTPVAYEQFIGELLRQMDSVGSS